ncbi:VPLPA-CTERM sorting domain-containing protein [Methylotuvimicrobium sp. KM1]|uniref:VPLPA-CTERM sorting domain-containing protein n=1 Tax=Methylotuvimicrobium sp. KM1 TaxID=3377707 RepID=UPI00384D6D2F
MEMKKSMLITAAAVIGLSINTAYAHGEHEFSGGEPYTLFHPEMTWVDGTGTATNVSLGGGVRTAAAYSFNVTEAGNLDVYSAYTDALWGVTSIWVFQKDTSGSDWTLTNLSAAGERKAEGGSLNIFDVPIVDYVSETNPGVSPAGLRDHFDVGEYMALVTIFGAHPDGHPGVFDAVGAKLSDGFNWTVGGFALIDLVQEVAFHDLTITASAGSSAIVQPVPVPAAIWFMGSALAGLGVLRRKKSTVLQA